MRKVKQTIKHVIAKLGAVADASLIMSMSALASGPTSPVVFDDLEEGNLVFVCWFEFSLSIGVGGIDPNSVDLAPIPDNRVESKCVQLALF